MERGICEIFEWAEANTPETQPQGMRSGPPRYPPAPPGTAGAGGESEEPRRTRMGLDSYFHDSWQAVQRLALYLQFQETVPADSAQGRLVVEAIGRTRADLARHLQEVFARLHSTGVPLTGTDLLRFKKELTRLMIAGQRRAQLDRELATDIFERVSAGEAVGTESLAAHRYQYPSPPNVSVFRLGLVSGAEFARVVIQDFVSVCAAPENSLTRHVFEREVVQRLLALLYAARRARTMPLVETSPLFGVLHRSTPSEDPEERRLREWKRKDGEPDS